MKLTVAVIAVVLPIACGCHAQQARPDAGSLSGNTYKNDYFKFSITFPQGWTVLQYESPTRIRLSETSPKTLLFLSSAPASSNGVFPRNSIGLVLLAEDVSQVSGVRNGKDVLTKITPLLTNTTPPHAITSGPTAVSHSGQQFYRLDYKQAFTAVTHYYCTEATVLKGFALRLSVIADSKQDAELGCAVAGTFTFY